MKKIILLGISICFYSISVSSQSTQQAYCTSNLHSNTCKQDYIDIVKIDGTSLHNSGTKCNDTIKSFYSFPAADSTTTTLTRGTSYTLGVLAYSFSKIGMCRVIRSFATQNIFQSLSSDAMSHTLLRWFERIQQFNSRL